MIRVGFGVLFSFTLFAFTSIPILLDKFVLVSAVDSTAIFVG
jgi:hypothetical protein